MSPTEKIIHAHAFSTPEVREIRPYEVEVVPVGDDLETPAAIVGELQRLTGEEIALAGTVDVEPGNITVKGIREAVAQLEEIAELPYHHAA
jgi:hypothetical protein